QFPEGLCTLQVMHHLISQPRTCVLDTCLLLTVPFRSMLLTWRGGPPCLAPTAHLAPVCQRSFDILTLRFTAHRVRWVPLFPSFQRLGAFALSPHPGVRGFPTLRLLCPIRLSPMPSGFRWTSPSSYFPTALTIHRGLSRVYSRGLKQAWVRWCVSDRPF